MEAVAKGKDMTILQTDFYKIYDYVNYKHIGVGSSCTCSQGNLWI